MKVKCQPKIMLTEKSEMTELERLAKTINDCELFPSCWGKVVRLEDVLPLEKTLELSLAKERSALEAVKK
jgi:hypothetical protein